MNATQIKQMLHHIVITITTTVDFKFEVPEQFKDLVQEMVNDKNFFEKIKRYMVEESLKDTPITKEEMAAIYDEVMSKYSVEKGLRLFGYFFCGTYVKEDHPTLIKMSDAFVCAFYKFYKEDPTSEFVFGVRKFIYSADVIGCGLLVAPDFMRAEMERISGMLNETMGTVVNHAKYDYVGNEFEWISTIITSVEPYRRADQVVYFIFTMGRTTMFDGPEKMPSFLSIMEVLWANHCAMLAQYNKPKPTEGKDPSIH